jgi:anaerobic magnesium-protoporphyrin IX monomethyl ester cyclase
LNILLTHGYFIGEDPKEQEIMKPYVPLGILCISAYLEQHAYENEVFDSTFSSFELLKKHLLKQQPDVIGIYTNLMTKLNVLRSFVL